MLDPEATVDVPDGLMDPPVPAEAVMVKEPRVKLAPTLTLLFMVT
jgi:hypothetical protein